MVRQILQQKQIEIKLEFGDFGIIEMCPKDIVLLDKNANFMSKSNFDLLVKNIEKDNAISQLPLLIYDFDKSSFIVISGNHRVKASIQAHLQKIPCIVWLRQVTKDEILRLQLSHNSIKGQDDKNILKEIIAEIKDIESLELSGITEEYLKKLPKIENIKLEAIDYEPTEMTFLFNQANVDEIIESINSIKNNQNGYIAVCGETKYKEFLKLGRDVAIATGLTEGQGIVSFNILMPILAKIAEDKVNRPDTASGDLAIDDFKQIIWGGGVYLYRYKTL